MLHYLNIYMKKVFIVVFLGIIIASYFLVERDVVLDGRFLVDDREVQEGVDEDVPFMVYPVEHASFVAKLGEVVLYNDPIGEATLYQKYGSADIILLSDIHGDHISTTTISALLTNKTVIVAPMAVYDLLPKAAQAQTRVLNNDDRETIAGIAIKAIPMYNLPESADSRHERGRGNGYVLTSGATNVYIAGDTADIPEMRSLSAIDYAFIPMNLPYTMSVESAAEAVLAFKPKVVYPYHYRTPEGKSDVQKFMELVTNRNADITVSLLPWYQDEVRSETSVPAEVGARINVQAVCEGTLAYTDFVDTAAATAFVADCVAGKHPEVIEQYIESIGADGARI